MNEIADNINKRHKGNKAVIRKSVGRPKLVLDTQLIYRLASIHCTIREMSNIMNCSEEALVNYMDVINKGYDQGKEGLRRLQWKSAQQGNVAMQIWLGKQWLQQRDRLPDEAPQTIINVQVNDNP